MRVGVLIVNTNAWPDVLECLESVCRSDDVGLEIVVADNGSADGSLDRIRDWAQGRLDVLVPRDNPLRPLSFPPVDKPIETVEYTRAAAETGGDPTRSARLVLIRNGENLGFTGANNVGLKYFLSRREVDYVWLLNPDTVVEPGAVSRMVRVAQSDPEIGLCGSTVRYYSAPNRVQVLGGFGYNRWLALPVGIGAGAEAPTSIDAEAVLARMAYVYGASMLVSRAFLEEVGLLNEDRYLYFDELDWVLRAAGRYRLGYSPESVVYHREGGSLGAGKAKSWNSDYYFMRNRIRITREFSPVALPTVYLALLVAAARRAARGHWDRVAMILQLLWKESFRSS